MKSFFNKQYLLVLPVIILFISSIFVFYQNCSSPFQVAELDLEENSFDVFDPTNTTDQTFLLDEDSLSLIEAETLLSSDSSSLNNVSDLKAHGEKTVLLNQIATTWSEDDLLSNFYGKSILSLQLDNQGFSRRA